MGTFIEYLSVPWVLALAPACAIMTTERDVPWTDVSVRTIHPSIAQPRVLRSIARLYITVVYSEQTNERNTNHKPCATCTTILHLPHHHPVRFMQSSSILLLYRSTHSGNAHPTCMCQYTLTNHTSRTHVHTLSIPSCLQMTFPFISHHFVSHHITPPSSIIQPPTPILYHGAVQHALELGERPQAYPRHLPHRRRLRHWRRLRHDGRAGRDGLLSITSHECDYTNTCA